MCVPSRINQEILKSYETQLKQLYEDKIPESESRDIQDFEKGDYANIPGEARSLLQKITALRRSIDYTRALHEIRLSNGVLPQTTDPYLRAKQTIAAANGITVAQLESCLGYVFGIRKGTIIPRKWKGALEPCPKELWDARNGIPRASLILTNPQSIGLPIANADSRSCFEVMGRVDEFFHKCFELFPINLPNCLMKAYIYEPNNYNNAVWLSTHGRVVFGNYDPAVWTTFIRNDIATHEWTHAVVDHCGAQLRYADQSGALNESLADVFAIIHEQWRANQLAGAADAHWSIGAGLFAVGHPREHGALRSLKNPADVLMGGQPAHMRDYNNQGGNDNGGVHHNSGIPNHAFYQAAEKDQGLACNRMGRIWKTALFKAEYNDDFSSFAWRTLEAAREYGDDLINIVGKAWHSVGVDLRTRAWKEVDAEDRQPITAVSNWVQKWTKWYIRSTMPICLGGSYSKSPLRDLDTEKFMKQRIRVDVLAGLTSTRDAKAQIRQIRIMEPTPPESLLH